MHEEFPVSMGLTCTLWPCAIFCQIIPGKEKTKGLGFLCLACIIKTIINTVVVSM